MKGPTPKKEDARNLFDFLMGRGFIKRRNIPMKPRTIRAICQHWPEHFMSSQSGYKCTREATDEEIITAVNDLRSRCAAMRERADKLEAVLTKRRMTPDLIS